MDVCVELNGYRDGCVGWLCGMVVWDGCGGWLCGMVVDNLIF